MLFVHVFLEPVFGAEDGVALFTFIPMLFLLVLQAKLAVMGRPSSEAPAAFNLVCMGVAIVEVLPKALRFKRPATALIHCAWILKWEISAGCDCSFCCVKR